MAGLITGTGKLAAAYEYDPWGKPISVRQDSIVQSLRYGAREYDSATGLYYNRARFYDPDLGRFISEDPIGLAGGINPYAYADGDPANLTDPSGLIPCIPGVTIYTSNLVCDLPGISNLAQFDWPAWMTRGQVPVGLHGQGNRLTGDMVMAMIAFQSIRRDYEQTKEEAHAAAIREAQEQLKRDQYEACRERAAEVYSPWKKAGVGITTFGIATGTGLYQRQLTTMTGPQATQALVGARQTTTIFSASGGTLSTVSGARVGGRSQRTSGRPRSAKSWLLVNSRSVLEF